MLRNQPVQDPLDDEREQGQAPVDDAAQQVQGDVLDVCVPQLALAQAVFTPDAPALITSNQIVSLPQLPMQDTAQPYLEEEGQCLHQLFEEQAARAPETIAILCAGKHLTYSDLNARANQLAHYLRQMGVGPEVMVGVCMQQSIGVAVALLGILKAGGAYVPLDPDYPAGRLASLLSDTQMSVLLTEQQFVSRLPEYHPRLICLDSNWSIIGLQSTTNPPSVVQGEHLAYVIYTSGSTGQPKGVLVEHHAIVAHCWDILQTYGFRPDDRILPFIPLTSDASLEYILPALLVGATLVMRGPELWSPTELLQRIKDYGLTVLGLPTAYCQYAFQEWTQTPRDWRGQQIRLMIVGGERLLPDTVQRWQQTPLRSARFLNVYGPTEATITATCYEIPGAAEQEQRGEENIPIGSPLPQRKLYILDTQGQPVSVGVAGELHIGGKLLARGYLNRPESTAECFISDPFSDQPQARLYKTGDRARYHVDGTIEFLGRQDQQVKILGHRIELGEVEVVLSCHPAVRQVVVVAREDIPGDRRLVAYVVLQKDQVVTISALRSHMLQAVPAYMVPYTFILLDVLPLTSNGKIDRQALPRLEPSRDTEEGTFVVATLPLHLQLVQIWEELLGMHPIGIKDDFFALGGHSLLAARMFDRIAHIYGKKVPLSTFFAGATIEHLAAVLAEETPSTSHVSLVTVQAGGSKRPFFYLHGDYAYGAFYCARLAQQLGADQPFYLLEPYKFDDLRALPSFEEIATASINAMRTVQPEGPYLLGGWCSGGCVAYEMARQLRTAGQTVDLLILVDPDTPARHRWVRRLGNLLHIDQRRQCEAFLALQHLYRYLRFAHYRQAKNAELLAIDAQGSSGRQQSTGTGLSLPNGLKALLPNVKALRQEYSNIYDWIAADYIPDLCPGKTTFFWTSEEPWRAAGWERVIKAKEGEIETRSIPGNHITSRTEYFLIFAQSFCDCVNRVQESAF